jgi:hypothetical protein
MKILMVTAAYILLASISFGQIQITQTDMPISGDALRYSVDITSGPTINLAPDTNYAWNFSSLVAASQQVDTYKMAVQVSPLYGITIPNAYGYKVADSIPGLPIPVTNIYNFFRKKNNPSRFVIEGYAATVASIPTPTLYSDEDEMFLFPLDFTNAEDSTTFALNVAIPGLGTLKRKGYRKTKADGWGTITTPYYTNPVNCLRVRSEIHEIDSIVLTTPPISFPTPVNSVEYKWLVNGSHYPALFVTANILAGVETVTNVRYTDSVRNFDTGTLVKPIQINVLKAYPNPVVNGIITFNVPSDWIGYNIEVIDMNGKIVLYSRSKNVLDIQQLSNGTYLAKVVSDNKVGYAIIIKNSQ